MTAELLWSTQYSYPEFHQWRKRGPLVQIGIEITGDFLIADVRQELQNFPLSGLIGGATE
jgi:hypothetical protein